jgi:beta-fructofuranosidase
VTLRLPDRWIWDFWFAEDGPDVHVFYLQAPQSLRDPDRRHWNATVGHAVSADLRNWTVLPDALGRGAPGSFDDMATWTGSVLALDGRWLMFYTGVSTRDAGLVQRIGVAASTDLVTWTRLGFGPLEADARWYEKPGPPAEEAWRDPWVFWDDPTQRFHMLVTARSRAGAVDGRGVIGHASSGDLSSWVVGPPLSEPGEFFALEVPQLVDVGGCWWLLFSAQARDHSAARLARDGIVAEGGTHYLRAQTPLGPFRLERDEFLVGDPGGRHYAGRLLRREDRWYFFAWQQFDDSGAFFGALSDPMPVVAGDATLAVSIPGR